MTQRTCSSVPWDPRALLFGVTRRALRSHHLLFGATFALRWNTLDFDARSGTLFLGWSPWSTEAPGRQWERCSSCKFETRRHAWELDRLTLVEPVDARCMQRRVQCDAGTAEVTQCLCSYVLKRRLHIYRRCHSGCREKATWPCRAAPSWQLFASGDVEQRRGTVLSRLKSSPCVLEDERI